MKLPIIMKKIIISSFALLITLIALTTPARAELPVNTLQDKIISNLEDNQHFQFAKYLYQNTYKKRTLKVTATAYTSHENQTDSTPEIAAWGDRLTPDMKVIAVSRDLLHEYGLTRGSHVTIRGLPGKYVVLDKMNKRWKKKIDIYMGKDIEKAYQWGRKKVIIEWTS